MGFVLIGNPHVHHKWIGFIGALDPIGARCWFQFQGGESHLPIQPFHKTLTKYYSKSLGAHGKKMQGSLKGTSRLETEKPHRVTSSLPARRMPYRITAEKQKRRSYWSVHVVHKRSLQQKLWDNTYFENALKELSNRRTVERRRYSACVGVLLLSERAGRRLRCHAARIRRHIWWLIALAATASTVRPRLSELISKPSSAIL